MPAVDYDSLAPYYDALVRDASDVPFFRDLAARAGGPACELMAGSGRVSVALAQAGLDLTCVDSSPRMLALLQAKLDAMGCRAHLACGDVGRVDLGREFALIFIAFHSFEELAGDDERRACLENARRHLAPDGRFVCTLHDVATRLRGVGPGNDLRRSFVDPVTGRAMTLALATSHDPATGIVSGLETLSHDDDDGPPIVSLPIRFRLVAPDEFERLARDAGLEVVSVHAAYGEAPYEPGGCATAVWTLRCA